MSANEERIAQFRKMATECPDDELANYRLGSLLMEEKQYDEAIVYFRKTLDLSPFFSKVYQLLAQSQIALGQQAAAVETLKAGFTVADERGDNMPRDEMSRLLVQLGQEAPAKRAASSASQASAGEGGFHCQRPMAFLANRAGALPAPPFNDELGRKIQEKICADCWGSWLRDSSIKVI